MKYVESWMFFMYLQICYWSSSLKDKYIPFLTIVAMTTC